jgi:hypothetical protein
MNSSGKTLTILLGALVIVTMLTGLLLSGVAATFAWMEGSGNGSIRPSTGAASMQMQSQRLSSHIQP